MALHLPHVLQEELRQTCRGLADADFMANGVMALDAGMERYQAAQALRVEKEFQAFLAVEGYPPAKSRRTTAKLLQMLEPRLQPERLRQLVRQAPIGHSRILAGPVHTPVRLMPFAARKGAS